MQPPCFSFSLSLFCAFSGFIHCVSFSSYAAGYNATLPTPPAAPAAAYFRDIYEGLIMKEKDRSQLFDRPLCV